MYKFTNQQQKDKFNNDLNDLITSFSKHPLKNKNKAINCTLQYFLNQQSNTRLLKRKFFQTENMEYDEFKAYQYLNYIWKAGLYEFTNYEISIFNPSFSEK